MRRFLVVSAKAIREDFPRDGLAVCCKQIWLAMGESLFG
jgi:hypothetical protein